MDSSVLGLSDSIVADSVQTVQQKANVEPGSLAKASLYVTDLDASVTETDLQELFAKHGQVISVKICRDLSTGISRGYGFVDFSCLRDATKARKLLNSEQFKGRRIRAMLSNRDSNLISGERTIFFKNFDPSFDMEDIDEIFSAFGTIFTSELAIGSDGRSKGHGYVMFNQKEAADYATSFLYNKVVNGRLVIADPYICKEERDREKTKFHNHPTLYVKNVTREQIDDEFESAFCYYGRVVHKRVLTDEEGYYTGSAIIVFENFDNAVSAIEGLNGKHPCSIKGLCKNYKDSDPIWYVGWARSMLKPKDQRQSRREKGKCAIHKKLEGANLYVKNFDDDMTERKLKQLFSDFGMVIYSKVMFDSQGLSRGCGFIGFVTPKDATKAMNAMNGKIIGRKPLHISVARHQKGRQENIQVLREECYSGTMFTQLARIYGGGWFLRNLTDMQHDPWYQNIILQEKKLRDDRERHQGRIPHPKLFQDEQVGVVCA